MPRLGGSKEEQKHKVVGELRRTQLITSFGSGSISDMPDYSVVLAATDYWKPSSPTLHEASLERLLKVSGFKEPYVSENSDGKVSPDLPAFRFPTMHFCPSCGRLQPYWAFGDEGGKKCKACQKNIVPSRFVAACSNGHLEDFPYRWWVHYGNYADCSDTRGDQLEISFSDTSGGLESIVIKCKACGKERTMAGCMSKDALRGYHCNGRRPWIGYKKEYNDPIACKAPMRGLQRSASNVYFSITESALTIPPWSTAIQGEINRCWDSLKSLLDGNPVDMVLNEIIKYQFSHIISHGKATVDELKTEIYRRYNQAGNGEYTKQSLREDEYKMFCAPDQDDPQFKTMHSDVPEFLSPFIEDIVLVKRLREVLALRGFRRITPDIPDENDERFAGYHQDGNVIPLSNAPLSWLPAIQMLGEGIFIKLDESALERWESAHSEYFLEMERRLMQSNVGCDNFSPRYVLLHTLSHLLIRQLSIECGYSGASIKERIYSSYKESQQPMAGILLYTSASDSDGSLGGLVRKGLAKPIETIFRNMLQEASWCSSDPICIESKAQGFDSLNYAACHACTLLPETSCEMRNCLLDRAAVTGTLEDRSLGFFGSVMNEL